MNIAVVDSGVANVGSVVNMLKRIGVRAHAVDVPSALESADAIILPGVGHFDAGMKHLRERGLVEALEDRVLGRRVPILGICLGMQLLTRSSEEGAAAGLSWLDAETQRLDPGIASGLLVPHMGWNETIGSDEDLFGRFEGTPRFYYVHSYHVVCRAQSDVAAVCMYGTKVTAAVRHRNIFGCQFHPEKSHRYGMKFLEAFVGLASGAKCSA
ncbi:MAG TPA: imidazole glycerol phosphate synthase subunit HisH [Polyangiaceae bacterium]|nr:imidazole glycerol phosphate synthase subunit HisH [Polyangiaceae bacterium]